MSNDPQNLNYKNTLNLPQTSFPMKADLPKREPGFIEFWSKENIYGRRIFQNEGKPLFVLHDGPPYANGHIHHGHILNKILKDIIVKYKNLNGFLSEYVPGWDCHGLPIEHQVDKDLGPKKKQMSRVEIRQACRAYAERFIGIQKEEFKRLGVFGRWDQPYLTMHFDYEANIAHELGNAVSEGFVYRGSKPVYWCIRCQTALAEAEVEYDEHRSPSIYVAFKLQNDPESISEKLKNKDVSFVIWTTTPWTLPANQAVAIHKNYRYAALEAKDRIFIVAEGLIENFKNTTGFEKAKIIDRFSAQKCEGLMLSHPFLDRSVPVVFSTDVTLEQGTGCVHIAPGHGQEDYAVGLDYQLPILNPVDAAGRFTHQVGLLELEGVPIFDANPKILEILKEKQRLLFTTQISHSYPHCWRCKNPVVFRSTPQWFISIEKSGLKDRVLDAIRRTDWVPSWGRERIYGMIENRQDWCISRQRSWGVPIIVFDCLNCHETLIDADVIHFVADLFVEEGADAWFSKSAEELLPPGTVCKKCGKKNFEKENDILDVWFDSGVSFAAVLEQRPFLKFPADLYLEGSDQHRGWFHSSLLVAIATRNQAPYKTVLTHGFVVDGQGKKYSKSAKNYVAPDLVLQKMGAEILRLWVAAEDYRHDIRVSDEILSRLSETYRKIRNTCRYLLGNLYDFNAEIHSVQISEMEKLDRWVLHQLYRLNEKIEAAYESYEFHQVYHLLNHFCTVELSSFYLDILKDRLYTEAPSSLKRRSAQTTLFWVTRFLTTWMAPILSFTAEEVWQALPSFPKKQDSIFLEDWMRPEKEWLNENLSIEIEKIREIREEVLKALEIARKEKIIGSSLDAQVRLTADQELFKILKMHESEWATYFIVSQVLVVFEIEEPTYQSPTLLGFAVKIVPAEGKKCERCWNYSITVGKNSEYPMSCNRCSQTLQKITSSI